VAIELLTCCLRPWYKDTNRICALYPHVCHTIFVPAVAIWEYRSVTKQGILLHLVTNVMMSGWRTLIDDPEFESRRGHADRLWGTPNLLSNGYGGSFPGVVRPGRDGAHSPPTTPPRVRMSRATPLHPHFTPLRRGQGKLYFFMTKWSSFPHVTNVDQKNTNEFGSIIARDIHVPTATYFKELLIS
jgi:hypothetical protein